MLSAFGEPPASGNSRPAWAAGAASRAAASAERQREQEAAKTSFRHEGREYKDEGDAFAVAVSSATFESAAGASPRTR